PAQIAALRSCPVLAEVWRNRSYALFKPNKTQYPAIIAAHNFIVEWTWGGDAMDHDTIALMKLKEEMRLRQQRHAAGATTRQRSDDSADKDDREQLVYRRTRQPGTLHQAARLVKTGRSRPPISFHFVGAELIVLRRNRTTRSMRAIS